MSARRPGYNTTGLRVLGFGETHALVLRAFINLMKAPNDGTLSFNKVQVPASHFMFWSRSFDEMMFRMMANDSMKKNMAYSYTDLHDKWYQIYFMH